MPTDNFLAQVAALHRRAVDAGMEGILPEWYALFEGDQHTFLEYECKDTYCILPHEAATAAVTHWLREWGMKQYPAAARVQRTPSELLLWAEQIIMQKELSNANPA